MICDKLRKDEIDATWTEETIDFDKVTAVVSGCFYFEEIHGQQSLYQSDIDSVTLQFEMHENEFDADELFGLDELVKLYY
jgi:hypothetical protein